MPTVAPVFDDTFSNRWLLLLVSGTITQIFCAFAMFVSHFIFSYTCLTYGSLSFKAQVKWNFRSSRVLAGGLGIFGGLYALFGSHNLGVLGHSWKTDLIFSSYFGYTFFETILLVYFADSRNPFENSGILWLLFHHFLVGGGAILTVVKAPFSLHYLGLLLLTNEVVVISYSILVIGRKCGYEDHGFIVFNEYALFWQYVMRQVLFIWLSIYLYNHRAYLAQCDLLTQMFTVVGLLSLTLIVNPFWTYECYLDLKKRKTKTN